jgi:N-acyl homoserine lactone hydrolase
MELIPLYLGFPARSHRGYLGLSSAYLVVGERLILYDTLGHGEREGLFARMEALGFSPLDVEVVILSHLHFDHAANADLFPWAEVWVHEMELVHAARVREDPRRDLACLAYLPQMLPHLRPVVEGRVGPGMCLLHLPGHTPGLLGLWLEGIGVLCSDAIKSRYDLVGSPAPPCLDPEMARESRRRLMEYPRLFPGHDVSLRKDGGVFVPEGEAKCFLRLGDGREIALRL